MTAHPRRATLRKPALTALGLVGLSLAGTGCGPDCYSACSKLYQEECNISAAGQTEDDLLQDCIDVCQDALNTPGDVDGYDPYEPQSSSSAIVIENDRQAALWMDCVDQTSCENIKGDQDGDGETDGKKMCLPHF